MTHLAYAQQAPSLNEQAVAQAELENYLEAQAEVVAPEELTVVEISFYDHQIYAGDKLIASITHDDDDFVTQRWVVMINDEEIHRADSWAKCHSYITWHYTQGTLPVQQQQVDTQAPATTGNEVMAQIAAACDEFGFELTDDGIYHNDVKLGQVGCTDGNWWVVRASSQYQNQVPCDSASDAVWSLWMVETSCCADHNEELLDQPFDQLTTQEWEQLLEYQPLCKTVVLLAA